MKKDYTFDNLLEIMQNLCGKDGCPWDKEQTNESLKRYLIEEAYEAIEAIDGGKPDKIAEELGDVLLQVVFHAQIGAANEKFDIHDIINSLCNKLISRHPHVFGDVSVETSEQVLINWDEIKKKEKNITSHSEHLKEVSTYLPALMRSYKVQQKASKIGFDWEDAKGALLNLKGEIDEFEEIMDSGDMEKINDEIGDILFSVVNVSRFYDLQPELALSDSLKKFLKRFEIMENDAALQGKALEDIGADEMGVLWALAKKK